MTATYPHRASPFSTLLRGLSEAHFDVIGRVELPAREARHAPPPAALHPSLHAALSAQWPNGLYAHQSLALAASVRGDDVCLATPTASGKSLVFMASAIDAALRDPNARVLALYPSRALIQDQNDKWSSLLTRVGLSHAVIDGGVGTHARAEIIRKHRIILMTPDVAHAWLLSHLAEREVHAFVQHLALVVLDEAHVYEGVFGTNMAYLMRRLRVASKTHRLIASTATVDDPQGFLRKLTGRDVTVIDANHDGAPSPARTIVHLSAPSGQFADNARLIAALARCGERFLAFADSRKTVEQVVAASVQKDFLLDETTASDSAAAASQKVLPYRAGLETEDRTAIQRALACGELAGVVSTSALELGVDIGEINLVVMLDVPPTVKSFRQRLGRAGRRAASVCLLVDPSETLGSDTDALARYLRRPAEPSWLYLENRYLQYANALCAAAEARVHGRSAEAKPYADLPDGFRALLDNELDPKAGIADDLYPLKQRAESGPHLEFPIRSGIEQNFQVTDNQGQRLGNLSFSQLLREAYPGAIYYYMATPYRVRHFDHRNGRVVVTRTHHGNTQPLLQSMVFPQFAGATQLRRGDLGFVAEAPVQVRQRVLGFSERKVRHTYGQGSPHHPRELNHFFATTGVCWHFPPKAVASAAVGGYVHRAFCELFGVHESDVGVGTFYAKSSPLGPAVCQGMCLFDSNHGSLRLTQRLVEHFDAVLERAIEMASRDDEDETAAVIEMLARYVAATRVQTAPGATSDGTAPVMTDDSDWMEVVAPGERAMLIGTDGAREVTVIGFRYTPRGALYELVPEVAGSRWFVPANAVQAIHGVSRTERTNLVTGEVA